jgi:hypothetical protein
MSDKKEGLDLSRLHMNQVGRDEATTEVIKPKLDSATKMRGVILVGLVLAALSILMWVQYERSGAIWESHEDKIKTDAALGEHPINKED